MRNDPVVTVVNEANDPLFDEVKDYLTSFDFPLAYLIQKKFKIGFSRAEKLLRQIEESRKNHLI